MNKKETYIAHSSFIISCVVSFILIAYTCGYIGRTPKPEEQYTYKRNWYQSKPNPFVEHLYPTNTVISVKDGYILSIDNFGFTNVDHLTTFRFINNLRVK